MGHEQVITRQDMARGRNDDGSESLATWKAATNTAYSQIVDVAFRHRFLIQETGGGGFDNFQEIIEFSLNGGTWTPVPASAAVIVQKVTLWYNDGDNAAQRLGGGDYQGVNGGMTHSDNEGDAGIPDLIGNDEFECEFCLQIEGEFANNGDKIRLRIIESAANPLTQYNSASLFDITVSKPALPQQYPWPIKVVRLLGDKAPPLVAAPRYYPYIAPAPFVPPVPQPFVRFQMMRLPPARAANLRARYGFYVMPSGRVGVVAAKRIHMHGGSRFRRS